MSDQDFPLNRLSELQEKIELDFSFVKRSINSKDKEIEKLTKRNAELDRQLRLATGTSYNGLRAGVWGIIGRDFDVPAVYLVCRDSRFLYVGQTRNFHTRMRVHVSGFVSTTPVCVLEFCDNEKLLRREAHWISAFYEYCRASKKFQLENKMLPHKFMDLRFEPIPSQSEVESVVENLLSFTKSKSEAA